MAVEGPSDGAVLTTLCRRAGHEARAAAADGKNDLFLKFHKILRVLETRFNPTHFLVIADLQPETDCPSEAARWRKAIRDRFPRAQLCLAIWELESWLLADPNSVASTFGLKAFHQSPPDLVGGEKPSEVLEDAYRRARGYHRGLSYHKEADGMAIAEQLNVQIAAENSPSLRHFLRVIAARQERLN